MTMYVKIAYIDGLLVELNFRNSKGGSYYEARIVKGIIRRADC